MVLNSLCVHSSVKKERFQMEQATLFREQDELRHRKERSERQCQESEFQRQEVTQSVNQIHQDREKVQRMAQQLSIHAKPAPARARGCVDRGHRPPPPVCSDHPQW